MNIFRVEGKLIPDQRGHLVSLVDALALERKVDSLSAEAKLLREAYDALISMDHYDATKYNPRSAAAIAALEAFESSRDKETT